MSGDIGRAVSTPDQNNPSSLIFRRSLATKYDWLLTAPKSGEISGGRVIGNREKLWVESEKSFPNDAGDPTNRNWVRAEIQLNSGSSFRVGFEGIVGGDDKTDIALDDVSFSAGCYKV